METWNFDQVDDDDNAVNSEPDYDAGDIPAGLDPRYERPSQAPDEAAQQYPFAFDDDSFTHERPERHQPAPLGHLPHQRLTEPTLRLDLDGNAAHPTGVSTPTSYAAHELVSFEVTDSEDEDEDEDEPEASVPDMPPARRSHRTSVVDLTEGSPQQSTSRLAKRKRSTDSTTASSSTRSKRPKPSAAIEDIDLANEAPSAEEELLQAQQQETIRGQQQALEDATPQKIGQRSCIICMETFTNCTATACGHFFCHECLILALRAAAKNSDRGTGSCPVCRKSLKENKKSDVIPIAFMTKKEYDRLHRVLT